MEITWQDVEVDKKYRYEEKYHVQCEVTVLEKKIVIDGEGEEYMEITMFVDKAFSGPGQGETVTYGKTFGKNSWMCNEMKFLTLETWFSYYSHNYKGG